MLVPHQCVLPASLYRQQQACTASNRLVPPYLTPRRRDLGHEFVDELEELFERYNPHYCRYTKQRDLDQWGGRLEQGERGRTMVISGAARAGGRAM